MPPAIVLLHGQPDFSVSLWPLREALRARLGPTVKIVVPDRPGYGANQLASTDFAGNVDWLADKMRRSGLGPVVVVGHSWAGGIAILGAAREPAAVGPPFTVRGTADSALAGIVALASIGPECLLPIDRWLARAVIGEALTYTSLKLARRILMREPLGILRHGLRAADRPYARASGLAMFTRPMWRSFLSEQRILISQLPSLNAALPLITVPTLVLHGSADDLIPAVTPRALVRHIANARRVELAGAGHDLHLRRTTEVAEHIANFARAVLKLA